MSDTNTSDRDRLLAGEENPTLSSSDVSDPTQGTTIQQADRMGVRPSVRPDLGPLPQPGDNADRIGGGGNGPEPAGIGGDGSRSRTDRGDDDGSLPMTHSSGESGAGDGLGTGPRDDRS